MIRKLVIANLSLLALLLASAVVNAWTHGSIAQSILSSLQVSASPPTLGGDGYRYLANLGCTTDSSNLAPSFSTAGCLNITTTSTNGNNVNGLNPQSVALQAKTSYNAIAIDGENVAAGQRVNINNQQFCYGMGDCSGYFSLVSFAGGPVNGDEGQGFQLFSRLNQQQGLDTGTISTVTRTTCNTTLTQAVTVNPAVAQTPQTFTVASTTGCTVGDWVVIDQQMVTGTQGSEAVQLTAVGGGTISGIFVFPHNNGTTVTPATVFGLSVSGHLGQGRVMVNTSTASTYSTGTVSATSGGGLTGSGTTWTNSMVGGNSGNIGCIAMTADDYTGPPFSGGAGTLKSWYQITSIPSTTSMGIFSFSVAGDTGYHGQGPGNGAYIIRPCVTILRIVGSTAIAETTATTWSVGNTIEVAISPYPDVTGLQWALNKYSPGGIARAFSEVQVGGARSFAIGYNLESGMVAGVAGQDYIPFLTGYACSQCGTGISISQATDRAILLDDAWGAGVQFTGTIATSAGVITLTASGLSPGTIGKSNVVTGPGVPARTFIASQSGGTTGGNGTYILAIQGCGSTDGGLVPCSLNVGPIALQAGHTDTGGKIAWSGSAAYIMPNSANEGLEIATVLPGGGLLQSKSPSKVGSGSLASLNYGGMIGTTVIAFSSLPTCAAGLEGMSVAINNSSTNVYNAAISSGGTNHVIAYCNGSAWVAH